MLFEASPALHPASFSGSPGRASERDLGFGDDHRARATASFGPKARRRFAEEPWRERIGRAAPSRCPKRLARARRRAGQPRFSAPSAVTRRQRAAPRRDQRVHSNPAHLSLPPFDAGCYLSHSDHQPRRNEERSDWRGRSKGEWERWPCPSPGRLPMTGNGRAEGNAGNRTPARRI